MSSIICTLYEKRYDRGVGALINSLVAAGFTGTVHVGYRGALPYWIGQCAPLPAAAPGVSTYRVGPLTVVFTALATANHFANYKPQFMAQLLDAAAGTGVERIFYFDPDIVLKGEWTFFEEWARDHVALCADVNAECGAHHPLRLAWRRYFGAHGMTWNATLAVYVNSGFLGVPVACRPFLDEWMRVQELMGPAMGGLGNFIPKTRTFLFHQGDQDALNATMDQTRFPLSIAGQDAMDFAPGGYLMSHAQGRPKPWDKPFIRHALGGQPPTAADKQYWRHVVAPLALYSAPACRWRRFCLSVGGLLGRFYRRA
ncbi:MAG: hypothetical protein H0X38_17025 [Planctomycetes bacterium]|nr:hypothetical protein [Planctomycetota bacterium]